MAFQVQSMTTILHISGKQYLNSNLSCSIKAGDYIVFQGDRELHVIVNPSSFTGTLSYSSADNHSESLSFSSSSYRMITVTQETYKYEP